MQSLQVGKVGQYTGDRATIQSSHIRLENWTDRTLMKFAEGLHLEWNEAM